MNNAEDQNQTAKESKMYFMEKAAWKKGEEIMSVLIGEKGESKIVIGQVVLEGYNTDKKPILISTDIEGNELFPVSNNLFELKKQFKDNERRLTPVSQERENDEDLSEEESEEESELEEEQETDDKKKEGEVKDLRQQKGGRGQERTR